jgi:hypothetical protein
MDFTGAMDWSLVIRRKVLMTDQGFSSLYLGDRFLRAVQYARDLHIENRKSTDVPYMAHLLGVASLVMGECGYVEFPITENEVIGSLLHDAAEDWGGLSFCVRVCAPPRAVCKQEVIFNARGTGAKK